MWGFIGSWAFVVLIFLVGAGLIGLGWYKSPRNPMRTLVAGLAIVVLTVTAGVVMIMPVTNKGAICLNTATPSGVNHIELDSVTQRELQSETPGLSRFDCRNTLRTRYLSIAGGYLVLSLAAGTALSQRSRTRREGRRTLEWPGTIR
jgi:hypothetical protein